MNLTVTSRRTVCGLSALAIVATLTSCSSLSASLSEVSAKVSKEVSKVSKEVSKLSQTSKEFLQDSPTTPEGQRVAHAFADMSLEVAHEDGYASSWSSPKLAGRTSLPDGARVSLWVVSNVSKGTTVTGYYVDLVRDKSKGTSGTSAWSQAPAQQVSLGRVLGSVVVGNVSSPAANSVRVSVDGRSVELPVTYGYFLVPGELTSNASATFTITLLDQSGTPFGTESVLSTSGTPTPSPSATATP